MVRNFFFLLLLMLFSLSAVAPAGAAVQVQSDRTTLLEQESFQLLFTTTQPLLATPDFRVLERDFTILEQRQESRVQSNNGERSLQKRWVVTVMPRKSGSISVPPIRFGEQWSPELTLHIQAASATAGKREGRKEGEDLFLELQVTPDKVMVQGQLLYTVRFFRAIEIAGAALSEPELSGEQAVVEKLGEDRSFESNRGGRRYQVVERRYALFPQKSGRLRIPPLQLDVQSGRRGVFQLLDDALLGRAGEIKRLHSEAVEVEVSAQPAETMADRYWLPAYRLQLLEKWQESPPRLQVGESVTRTLTLLADGLPSAQLPELTPLLLNGPGGEMKIYPDQPQLTDQRQATGIIGMRQEKFALLPNKAGQIVLPAIEIAWWNVEKQSREIARLPERVLMVAPAAQRQSDSVVVSDKAAQPTVSVPAALVADKSSERASAAGELFAYWLVPVLATGWGLTLLLWGWSSWRRRHRVSTPSSVGSELPKQNHHAALRRACLDNAPQECRRILLFWAQERWPQQRLAHLNDLQHYWQRMGWQELLVALHELHRCCFATQEQVWQGERFWQQLQDVLPQQSLLQQEKLPPLYPLQ
ncbi:BatD family protein [Candidatus Magnetaquicoccus inordinatus]|uniref:BatD family protein n=1 Tax=Candidatus Magnetaquicoccus inordinatus TaxID=2496818 RepID=UPI00102B46F4|nr:BatD family protein [Candidatus Magnetaquicoccus inordinatus]